MPRVATAKKTATRRVAPAAVRRYRVGGYGAYKKRSYKPRVSTRSASTSSGMKYPGAGSAIGGAIGSVFGPAGGLVGSALGGLAHKAIHALTGFGDYQVKSNALLETNGPPRVENRGKEFVVRHREYIQDIYSASGSANTPSAFAIQGYSINPGSFGTFPWLSAIADKFEQYRIEGMVFEYKSLYSDAVVTQNGSIGSIILATEYNAGAPGFPNKQTMENYEFGQSCKPSCSVLHPIECARSQNVLSELYVRAGSVPVGEDVKTYDFGDFYIASQGIPLGAAGAAVNLGELWVTYQISFLKPKIPTASSAYVDSGFAAFSSKTGSAPWGTTAVPFNKVFKLVESNLPITLTSDNTFTITLGSTAMNYQLDFFWRAFNDTNSATPAWHAPGVTLTNATVLTANQNGPSEYIFEVMPKNGASGLISNGCSTHYMFSVPAATPSNPTATVVIPDWTGDQVNAVRFDGYFNAIPLVLNTNQ